MIYNLQDWLCFDGFLVEVEICVPGKTKPAKDSSASREWKMYGDALGSVTDWKPQNQSCRFGLLGDCLIGDRLVGGCNGKGGERWLRYCERSVETARQLCTKMAQANLWVLLALSRGVSGNSR